jgi:hypothetical protein|tara:strand:+ start:850 stop:1041 length:192 start_codon:yes stop_codon:yes gene_type:complete
MNKTNLRHGTILRVCKVISHFINEEVDGADATDAYFGKKEIVLIFGKKKKALKLVDLGDKWGM